MKKIKKYRIILVVFLVVLFFVGVYLTGKFPQPAEPEQTEISHGSASDNVTGWAWGGGDDGIYAGSGWISFNCYNYYNLAVDNTLEDRCSPEPTYYDYGVHIDSSTGGFSGEAWVGGGEEKGVDVPMLGWLSFDRSETGNPPAVPFNTGDPTDSIARLDFQTGQVLGWMKALAADGNGWDGWIKLGGDTGGTWPTYGGEQVSVNLDTKRFCGWAWGGDVVGWISFNLFCDECDSDGDGVVDADAPDGCAAEGTNMPPLPGGEIPPPVDINFPPTANYSEIAWDCCTDSRNPWFSWTFYDPEGLDQKAYQIQIDDGDFSVTEDIEWDYTTSDGTTSTTYRRSGGTELDWNTSYNWRVRVKDSADNWSDWTDWQTADPTISPFTTPNHAYPDVSFTWAPNQPSAKENVSFTSDASICYDADGGCLHLSKDGNDIYSWTFTLAEGTGTLNWDADDYPFPYTYEDYDNPVVSFSDEGDWDVTLTITDGSGLFFDGQPYRCSLGPITVPVREPLPWWKEIIPR